MDFKIKISIITILLSNNYFGQILMDKKQFNIKDSNNIINLKLDTLREINFLDSNKFVHFYVNKINHNFGLEEKKSKQSHIIGTWTKYIDTIVIDSSLFIFSNPFPHVYLHKEVNNKNSLGLKTSSIRGYCYEKYEDGYMSACILNDSLGTLKCTWYKGILLAKGHYWDNTKNGMWQYWNKNGKLYREEIWDKGVLKDTKEIP